MSKERIRKAVMLDICVDLQYMYIMAAREKPPLHHNCRAQDGTRGRGAAGRRLPRHAFLLGH